MAELSYVTTDIWCCAAVHSRATIMRIAGFVIALLLVTSPARADPPKVAVFDFELVDTSLQGEVDGPRTDEQGRLLRAGDQLRRALAESGKFVLLDIAPVNAAAHGSNLQACGGCDGEYQKQLGACYVIPRE